MLCLAAAGKHAMGIDEPSDRTQRQALQRKRIRRARHLRAALGVVSLVLLIDWVVILASGELRPVLLLMAAALLLAVCGLILAYRAVEFRVVWRDERELHALQARFEQGEDLLEVPRYPHSRAFSIPGLIFMIVLGVAFSAVVVGWSPLLIAGAVILAALFVVAELAPALRKAFPDYYLLRLPLKMWAAWVQRKDLPPETFKRRIPSEIYQAWQCYHNALAPFLIFGVFPTVMVVVVALVAAATHGIGSIIEVLYALGALLVAFCNPISIFSLARWLHYARKVRRWEDDEG